MSEILLIDWLTGIGQTSLTFLVSAGLADRPSYEGSARVLNSRHWQQTVAVSEGISFKLNDVFTITSKRRFTKISQSLRRPILGSSPG